MTIAEIEKRLPHRSPILLINDVIEVAEGEYLIARTVIAPDDEWCSPEYDPTGAGRLVYPPMLVVEALCQAAGLLVTWQEPNPDVLAGQVMLLTGLGGARTHAVVPAGSVIEHRVGRQRDFGQTVVFDGCSTVDGRVVLAVERIVMSMRPARELRRGDGRFGAAGQRGTGPTGERP